MIAFDGALVGPDVGEEFFAAGLASLFGCRVVAVDPKVSVWGRLRAGVEGVSALVVSYQAVLIGGGVVAHIQINGVVVGVAGGGVPLREGFSKVAGFGPAVDDLADFAIRAVTRD